MFRNNMRMDAQTNQVGHTNCKEFCEKNTWNSTGRIWKSLWTFKMLVDVYSLHLRFTHVLVGIGSNGFLSISSWTEIQSCPSGHHPKLPFPASVTKAKAHKKMMFLGCGEAQITWMVRKKHANHEPAKNWFYPSTFTALVPNSYTNRKDDLLKSFLSVHKVSLQHLQPLPLNFRHHHIIGERPFRSCFHWPHTFFVEKNSAVTPTSTLHYGRYRR